MLGFIFYFCSRKDVKGMSDGNFNRALLPHTPYASGLKAGKAMARMRAVEVFTEWLREMHPELSVSEVKAQAADFSRRLSLRTGT